MKLIQNTEFIIEKEEGLALLEAWEKTEMNKMNLYNVEKNDLGAFIKVGNALRRIEKESFIRVDAQDFYLFAVCIITNQKVAQ